MFRVLAAHLVVAFTLLAAQPTFAEIVIDPFSDPVTGQTVTDTTNDGIPAVSSLDGLNVYGGVRELFVNKTGQDGIGTQGVTGSANEVVTGIFNFDQFSSTARGVATLVYDGVANGQLDPQGFATAIDLTGGGLLGAFVLKDMLIAGSGLLLTVNLYNDATGALLTSGPVALPDSFVGDFWIMFSSFSGDLSAASNVGAIELILDGSNSPGSDARFGLVQTVEVPEPSWIAFGAVSSLIGACCRYRRRKAAPTTAE